MTASVALTRSDRFVYERLAADAALTALVGGPTEPRIFADVAPIANESWPVVIFQVQDEGNDTRTVGSIRVMERPLYIVKAVDQTQTWQGTVKDLADRIDAALDRVQGVVDDGTVIACTRLRPFRLAEVDGGVHYKHLGAQFRVLVRVA